MAQALPEDIGKCLCCNYRSKSEEDFLKHVKVHRFEPNFRVPCMVCPQVLKDIKQYKKHKKYCLKIKTLENKNEKEQDYDQDLFWQCQNCPEKIQINEVQNIIDFQNITKHMYTHSRKNER